MKTKVYWTLSPLLAIPSVIFENPIKYPTLAKCPVVSDHATRSRYLLSPYDLKIKPNWFYNQVTENYMFDGYEISSKDVLEENLWSLDTVMSTDKDSWYNPNHPQFQVVMPYTFITEENIDMSLIGLQSSETESNLDSLRYIGATLPIGKMARPLSSAWAFINKEQAHFKKGQPHNILQFSKPVELLYFTPGELFTHYCKSNNGFVNYQSGTKFKFNIINMRKPKKLIKEIKANVVYSEV